MRALLLAIATLALAAPAPADAQTTSGMGFSARSGSGHHGDFDRRDGRRDDRRRHDRRRDRDGNDVIFYDYYRDYQGDSLWRSDSFNDWWHDRPDRAYPRWMVNNQNCERKWYAADTLRC